MILGCIRHMFIKEFLQSLRDRRMRMVIFVAPVIQLVMFGYAVNPDVRNVSVPVCDVDGTPESRELVNRFIRSGHFELACTAKSDSRVRHMLDRGEVQAVLRIDPGFAGDLASGRTAEVQLLVDGADSNTAGIVLNYAAKIVTRYSREMLERRLVRVRGALRQPGRIELQTRAWYNANLESRNYYLPGVMATIVTLMSLTLTAMAIVREKEIGTIEQILVTPIRPGEIILGKTLPFALISLLDVILVSVVGVFWFGMPIRGNPVCLLLGVELFLLTTLGIGLLISTISHTQQQALMTSFFFFMPAMLLSGFMFPVANMPEPVQWLSLLNPLRHFLVIIRGVVLKGVGLDIRWPQMLALALLGAVTLVITTRRFHKTLG